MLLKDSLDLGYCTNWFDVKSNWLLWTMWKFTFKPKVFVTKSTKKFISRNILLVSTFYVFSHLSGNEDGWCENSKMVWIRKKVHKSWLKSMFWRCQNFFLFFFQGNLDYHQDMDGTNFNKWAEEAFSSLPPRSVIVMVKIMKMTVYVWSWSKFSWIKHERDPCHSVEISQFSVT